MDKRSEVLLNLDGGTLVRRYSDNGHAVAFIRDGNVIRPVFNTKSGKFYPRTLLSALVPGTEPASPEQTAKLQQLGWPWGEPLSSKEAQLVLSVWADFLAHKGDPKGVQAAQAAA